MSKLPTDPLRTLASSPLLWCGVAGLIMGQVISAMAAQRAGSLLSLVCALVFLLAGGTATVILLVMMSAQRRNHPAGVPVKTWLWTMSAGVLASVYL